MAQLPGIDQHVCSEHGIIGVGDERAEVLGIGIAPGQDEWRYSRQPFTGQSGKLLRAFWKSLGHEAPNKGPMENWHLTNGLCWWKDAPTTSELDACWPRLKQEIDAVRPKLMVVFGAIMRDYLLPNQRRGHLSWSNKYHCWTMYTVHPAAILNAESDAIKATHVANLMRDLQKIEHVLDWRQGPRPLPQFEVVFDRTRAQEVLDSWQPGDRVSMDIEARYQGSDDILCVGLTGPARLRGEPDRKYTWVIDEDALLNLRWPSSANSWTGQAGIQWVLQNGLFDAAHMYKKFGVEIWITEDTLLQSYSLDERGGKDNEVSGSGDMAVGIHNLEDICCEYLGVEPWKHEVKKYGGVIKTWDSGPEGRQRVYAYNTKDAAYTLDASDVMRQRQREDNVRNVYEQVMIPAANALREIKRHGGLISVEGFRDLCEEWMPRELELEDYLKSGTEINNLNSTAQVSHHIFDVLGCEIPQISKNRIKREQTKTSRSINRYALEEYMKQHTEVEWLNKYIEYKQISHLVNTYLTGIDDDIEEDGRVHPDPIMQGTRTGRLAYHNPPIQTIPKHGEELAKVRKIFTAPEGYELMEADFRQLELWMAYFLSGDQALYQSLLTGDFHAATTERVFGIPPTHPDFNYHRYESKRVTFGVFYGRGEQSLTEAFGHTNEYWRAIINKWAQEYHVYWDYIQRQKAGVRATGEQVTLSGRKRRYHLVQEKALNSAINMPIQSTGHEQLLCSLTELQLDRLLEPLGGHILWEIHDSIVLETPVAMRDDIIKVLSDTMTKPRFGLPEGLLIDVKTGKTWYDMEDYASGLK